MVMLEVVFVAVSSAIEIHETGKDCRYYLRVSGERK